MAIVSAVMVKKTKKEPTEWALGQPLVFPKTHNPTDVNLPRGVTDSDNIDTEKDRNIRRALTPLRIP